MVSRCKSQGVISCPLIDPMLLAMMIDRDSLLIATHIDQAIKMSLGTIRFFGWNYSASYEIDDKTN